MTRMSALVSHRELQTDYKLNTLPREMKNYVHHNSSAVKDKIKKPSTSAKVQIKLFVHAII